MGKDRLTAFSDGVIAILITIMVLELRTPAGASLGALLHALPELLVYAVSFVYLAIYWNNHHHFFQLVPQVNGAILWANLDLLFWLSLIPFTTDWVGRNLSAPLPTSIYGVSLLLAAAAWYLMQIVIVRTQGPGSPLAAALGSDRKGKISMALYAAGIALAFLSPAIADGLYVLVALLWFVPDRRIERHVVRGPAPL